MFGLERAALYPIAGAWTGAAMLLTMLHIRLGVSWPGAFAVTTVPAVIITLASLFLIQGKPPGYLLDWLEEHFLGQKDADRSDRKIPHPLHASQPRT